MFNLILYSLGLFSVLDSSAALGIPYWRETYGFIFALTVATLLATLFKRGLPRIGLPVISSWLLLSFTWLALVILQPVRYPQYIVGDFAVIIYPALLYFLILYEYPKGVDTIGFRFLLGCTFFGAIIAPITGNTLWGAEFAHRFAGAFKPPHIYLVSNIILIALNARKKINFVVFGLASLLVFGLAFQSSQRTNSILWVITLGIAIFQRTRVITPKMIFITFMAFIFVGGLGLVVAKVTRFDPGAIFEGTRYETLKGDDDSLQGRFDEAHDIINITRDESGLLHILLGYGHGATFVPFYSKEQINLTEEYRIHNIHIGPMMIFYRYGLVGVGMYALLGWMLFRDILRSRKLPPGPQRIQFIFYLNVTTLFYINSFMRTALNDPLFSLCLAGYLVGRTYLARPPRTGSRAPRVSSVLHKLPQTQHL